MALGRLRGAFLISALGLLALAPSHALAAVGTPIDLGTGDKPNVTVEPDGTADIAFTGRGVNTTQLFYCKLPRGATLGSSFADLIESGNDFGLCRIGCRKSIRRRRQHCRVKRK